MTCRRPSGSGYLLQRLSLGRLLDQFVQVSGKTSGGTSYHNRFVFVPHRLYIQKAKGATELVLKKDGDKISVVEVR